jgi:propionate CoA-transferase
VAATAPRAPRYPVGLRSSSNLFVSAAEAVARIADGAAVAIGGSGSGHAIPDALLAALGDRFRASGSPKQITLLHAFGVGDQQTRGLQHVAEAGMLRRVVGGHWSMAPKMAELARASAFPAYCLPAGVMIQMFHCAAAGGPGWMTHVGLHTFIDPRLQCGRLNEKAAESLVELVERDGREWLFYPTIPIDVALIKAWKADPAGNLSMSEEAGWWHNLTLAMAAKAAGGLALAVVRERTDQPIHPREVKVPGRLLDAIVVDPTAGQTFQTDYEPAYNGDARRPDADFGEMEFSPRKVIARRAAQELAPGAILNVGFGVPDGVMAVAREQGFAGRITTTIEHGQFGGVPALGLDFGAVWNPDAIVETPHMFILYQGRGVDQTFLGFLEIDREGNVNVSQLGDRIVGVGGFVDISQRAKKLAFCGTLSVRAEIEIADGLVRYSRLGKPKLVERVSQVTFSGDYARRLGQEVVYVTESAVFRLTREGLTLEEIAPGVDVERDLVPQMGFRPAVAPELRTMPGELFRPGRMSMAAFPAFADPSEPRP